MPNPNSYHIHESPLRNIPLRLDKCLRISYSIIANGARLLMGLVVRPRSHQTAGNFPATFLF